MKNHSNKELFNQLHQVNRLLGGIATSDPALAQSVEKTLELLSQTKTLTQHRPSPYLETLFQRILKIYQPSLPHLGVIIIDLLHHPYEPLFLQHKLQADLRLHYTYPALFFLFIGFHQSLKNQKNSPLPSSAIHYWEQFFLKHAPHKSQINLAFL